MKEIPVRHTLGPRTTLSCWGGVGRTTLALLLLPLFLSDEEVGGETLGGESGCREWGVRVQLETLLTS